jgi:hypothetical protein
MFGRDTSYRLVGTSWGRLHRDISEFIPAQAKQEAEAKGYVFFANHNDIVAQAKKEGKVHILYFWAQTTTLS